MGAWGRAAAVLPLPHVGLAPDSEEVAIVIRPGIDQMSCGVYALGTLVRVMGIVVPTVEAWRHGRLGVADLIRNCSHF